MESSKKDTSNKDNLVSNLFPEFKYEQYRVTDNKHFDIKTERKIDEDKIEDSRIKESIDQWFDSLSIDQRVEAVSTIFDKNIVVLNNIRKDLDLLASMSHFNQSELHITWSNDLARIESSLKDFKDSNSLVLNFLREDSIWRQITFLTVFDSEDTLTVKREFVRNSRLFLSSLK